MKECRYRNKFRPCKRSLPIQISSPGSIENGCVSETRWIHYRFLATMRTFWSYPHTFWTCSGHSEKFNPRSSNMSNPFSRSSRDIITSIVARDIEIERNEWQHMWAEWIYKWPTSLPVSRIIVGTGFWTRKLCYSLNNWCCLYVPQTEDVSRCGK